MSTPVKIYELYASPGARALPLVGLCIVTVVFSLFIVSKGPSPVVIVAFVAMMGWPWWVILTLAYRIVVHDDGSVECVALARRVRIPPENVREIGPDSTGGGFFRILHTSGKVRFLNQITGFHEVIVHIKRRNPSVVLKGC
jgi:hypothetical protein